MTIKELFEFQHFTHNKKLDTLIEETQQRLLNNNLLSEEDLMMVAAAGEKSLDKEKADKNES